MDRIVSTQNPRVKAARALQTVKGRDESGMFLCEGEHMVREAVRAAGEQYALSSAFAMGSAFAAPQTARTSRRRTAFMGWG